MPQNHWSHAPPHWLFGAGHYVVTASTYHRERRFDTPAKLDLVTHELIESAKRHGWKLKAWAVLSNHYHFIAQSPPDTGESLREWLRDFHRNTAIKLNQMDGLSGRRVWMNFRETQLTYQASYMARLRYVNENPVKHGLVDQATEYRWCSSAWFESSAPKAFVESVRRFKTDRLKIPDEFEC